MPKDKNPLEDLCRILAAMGKTGEDVAAVLRASDCRGFMLGTGGFTDPLTRYIYRKFDDGIFRLLPVGWFKWGTLILHRIDGTREEIPLPEPTAEFLELFQREENSLILS